MIARNTALEKPVDQSSIGKPHYKLCEAVSQCYFHIDMAIGELPAPHSPATLATLEKVAESIQKYSIVTPIGQMKTSRHLVLNLLTPVHWARVLSAGMCLLDDTIWDHLLKSTVPPMADPDTVLNELLDETETPRIMIDQEHKWEYLSGRFRDAVPCVYLETHAHYIGSTGNLRARVSAHLHTAKHPTKDIRNPFYLRWGELGYHQFILLLSFPDNILQRLAEALRLVILDHKDNMPRAFAVGTPDEQRKEIIRNLMYVAECAMMLFLPDCAPSNSVVSIAASCGLVVQPPRPANERVNRDFPLTQWYDATLDGKDTPDDTASRNIKRLFLNNSLDLNGPGCPVRSFVIDSWVSLERLLTWLIN